MQDAALYALAALAMDSPPVATVLARPPVDGSKHARCIYAPDSNVYAAPPLTSILALTKSRVTDVQLAASLW